VNPLVERLKETLKNEDARYAYADTVVNSLVSAQIRALREDRGLSQEELADLVGTQQSGISRLEKPDYSMWKIETLRRLARAFGVRLRISFDGFGTLPPDIGGFTREKLCPPRFEDDLVFKSGVGKHRGGKEKSYGLRGAGFRRKAHSVQPKPPNREWHADTRERIGGQ
jgi:transcriptional regulator with XRE-family HTH domain